LALGRWPVSTPEESDNGREVDRLRESSADWIAVAIPRRLIHQQRLDRRATGDG